MRKNSSPCRWPEQWIAAAYTAVLACVMLLNLFLAEHISYACKKEFACSNWVYLLVGAALLAVLVWTVGRLGRIFMPAGETISSGRLIALLSVLLACVQFYCVYNYYFRTGWDVGGALLPMVEFLTHGTEEERGSYEYHWFEYYFSVYPNNQLLMFLLSWIRRFTLAIGWTRLETAILCYAAVQCVLCALVGWLLFRILERLTGRTALAWWGWVFYVAMVATSPWFSIPYSDAMGLLFPTLTAWLYLGYLDSGRKRNLFFLGLFGYWGFKIKPQAGILLIAVVLLLLLGRIKSFVNRSLDVRDLAKRAGSMALGLVLAAALCTAAVDSLGMNLDREQEYGWQHFLMMGLNRETGGIYSGDDVYLSGGIPTRQERNKENLTVAKDRLLGFGFVGLGKFMARKALTNFSDGTFAWAEEGEVSTDFFQEIYPERNTVLSPFLRSLYYDGGQRLDSWMSYAQTLWLLCLAGGLFAVLYRPRGERDTAFLSALMLGVLGLTAFELLFEARARYLFTFTPIFVILATLGWSAIGEKLRAVLKKR